MRLGIKLSAMIVSILFAVPLWWMVSYTSRVQLSMSGSFQYLAKTNCNVLDLAEKGNTSDYQGLYSLDSDLSEDLQHKDEKCTWESQQHMSSICSFNAIEAYMTQCGSFPDEISISDDNTITPHFCTVPETSKDDIWNYFHDNIQNFVILGDSNGIRFAGGIKRQLERLGTTCYIVKSEEIGFVAHKEYFYKEGKNHDALLDVLRTCRFCTAFKCSLKIPPTDKHRATKLVSLEFISFITNLMNSTIVNSTYCDQNQNVGVCRYKEYSDFLFRFYLSQDSPPDVLVMVPSFAHDTRQPLNRTIPKLSELKDLIASSLPPTSNVIWFPSLRLNLQAFRPKGTESQMLYGGRNENIHLLNHLLFEVLQKSQEERLAPKFHGFVDVGEVARIREMQWATDMVHYREEFYDTVSTLLLKLLPSLNNGH